MTLRSLVAVTFAASVVALSAQAAPESDLRIWSEFVALQKSGSINETHIRPAYVSKPVMLEFLGIMRRSASWPEWEKPPEIYRVGARVHFVTRLSENGVPNTYSFTFLVEDGRWFLEHFEGIVVRLDKLGPLPVSTFPDLNEGQKAWMRQEKYWSTMVDVFAALRQTAGTEAAFNFFKDGPGYLVEAKTWVPFYAPDRAFIVYLAWEQARLQGNAVTLETLADNEAVVSIDPVFLRLYAQSAHMRERLDRATYVKLFETIWEDRARAAGWKLQFVYADPRVTLRFTR